MYEEFFGLSRRPFSLTPDPEFIYWTDQHRYAYDLICMSLLRQAPIAVITGEVGAGKTTLIQALLREISDEVDVGLLSNVVGDSGDLLRWILTAFGQDCTPATRAEALREVEAFLRAGWDAGRRAVLIVDEAQNVSDHGIETLRLLTNLDVGKRAPLSVILAGQPQLRDRLAAPGFAAFRQRLGASFHLEPMTLDETAGYVRNRIEVSGGHPSLFERAAIEAVYRRAGGVPRLTNLLCDLCLVAAYGEDRDRVDGVLAETALAETLAAGGLGGLPAEAEQQAEIAPAAGQRGARRLRVAPATRFAAPGGVALAGGAAGERHRPPSASELQMVGDEGALAADAPLHLGGSSRVETARPADPVPLPLLSASAADVRGGQVWRRVLGSVAGAAVAASVAGLALILPTTDTDGGRAPTLAGMAMPTAARFPAPASLAPDVVEARPAPADPAGGELLFARALEGAAVDPLAAAVDYSRAAARGHGRAAYYLAQMYETGDGLGLAPDTAWKWYAVAADEVPGADQRRGEAAAVGSSRPGVAVPLFSSAEAGAVELVWQGRGPFVVELAAQPDAAEVVYPTPLTAVRLEAPRDAAWWRVRAVGAEPSAWMPIGATATF